MSVVKVLSWVVGVFVLFIVLSPGMLLTIPPQEGKSVLTVGEVPWLPVLTHALIFGAVYGIAKVIAWALRRKGSGGSASSSVPAAVATPAAVASPAKSK